MTSFRSRMLYAAFAAGAILGCLAASALGPQFASADRLDLLAQSEGLPHLNQKDIAEIKEMLAGLSQTQGGEFVFDKPVKFAKPAEFFDATTTMDLRVECAPDADSAHPSMKVCGPAVFENALGTSKVLINDRGAKYPEPDFQGPAVQVKDSFRIVEIDPRGVEMSVFVGPDDLPELKAALVTNPDDTSTLAIKGNVLVAQDPDLPDTTGQVDVVGSFRTASVTPSGIDLIELLVIGDPDNPVPVSRASLLSDPDLGSRLEAGHIDADTIRAFSIEEFQLPPPIEAGSF
jgi:hypothetical protein